MVFKIEEEKEGKKRRKNKAEIVWRGKVRNLIEEVGNEKNLNIIYITIYI